MIGEAPNSALNRSAEQRCCSVPATLHASTPGQLVTLAPHGEIDGIT